MFSSSLGEPKGIWWSVGKGKGTGGSLCANGGRVCTILPHSCITVNANHEKSEADLGTRVIWE